METKIMTQVDYIKAVRNKLGCEPRTARDFYDTYGYQCLEKADEYLASGKVYDSPLAQVRAAIHRYQKSLDGNENPAKTAIEEIEKILGIPYPTLSVRPE